VVKAFKSFQMFPVPDGESGQSCGVLELEGSGWPRYIRTPPAGSPPPGSPSVSLGHGYVQRLCPRVNWLEGRAHGKGGAGGVAQPIAALEILPSTSVLGSISKGRRSDF
jgi:hypothetical protein